MFSYQFRKDWKTKGGSGFGGGAGRRPQKRKVYMLNSVCRLKAVIGKEDFLLPNEQYVGFRAN
jgi:hypothetical protein